MAKMWEGRTDGNTNKAADDFNSSIRIDKRMFAEDITGSIAHVKMLAKTGILDKESGDKISEALSEILDDILTGKLAIDENAEDIHMFVEQVLTERIGDTGKKLHTARSRNDQVALDTRLYLIKVTEEIEKDVTNLIKAITDKAEEYKSAIMPGYTHMQRAQPVSFGHQLLAYSFMFLRDLDRLKCSKSRTAVSPIGCCALAGTTYNTDRLFEAEQLSLEKITDNSIDGVSDRDFCIELASCIAIIMMHLSRLSEELVLWSSWEFKFIDLSNDYTTGSSIMPQKKNPDMAELIRGKTGRVYGDLMALLTMMKGLPLAYNKDMQEDKEQIFDACDTVKACLEIMAGMIETMTANTDNMKKAAQGGFINATDLADYLVGKGLPFRDAYKVSGKTVSYCIENGKVLESLSIEEYKNFSPLIENDVYDAVDLMNCLNKRNSEGGPCTSSVEKQIQTVRSIIK